MELSPPEAFCALPCEPPPGVFAPDPPPGCCASCARSLSCSCRLMPLASAKPTMKPRTVPARKMRTILVLTDDCSVMVERPLFAGECSRRNDERGTMNDELELGAGC